MVYTHAALAVIVFSGLSIAWRSRSSVARAVPLRVGRECMEIEEDTFPSCEVNH